MCYQKVNQNWRKSKHLLSLEESRFSQLHTVTWTPRPPANSPLSTSSQPPPTGMGTVKCISLNPNSHPQARIKQSHHVFSYSYVWKLLTQLLFKIYHSLKSLEITVLILTRAYFIQIIFTKWTLQTLGVPAIEWRSFRFQDGKTLPCS